MGTVTLPNQLTDGQPAVAAEVMANFNAIITDYNTNITNGNIAGGAAIEASKLDLTIPGAIGSATPSSGKFTTLEATTSLKLATGATVTGIDNGDVGTGSATLLATQGAIKTYVDSFVNTGRLIQMQYEQDNTELTGLDINDNMTNFWTDDDLMTWDEGYEYTQLATTITPTGTGNILEIEVEINMADGNSPQPVAIGLFQDPSGSDNCVANNSSRVNADITGQRASIKFFSTNTTASVATTFKVRVGSRGAASSTRINQNVATDAANANMGGGMYSRMVIKEYSV